MKTGKPKAVTLSEKEWMLIMSALYEAADCVNDWSLGWTADDLTLLTSAVQKLNMELRYLLMESEGSA